MMCIAELRGLGDVHQALVDQGGSLLAVSVDAVTDNKRVAKKHKIAFPILSDEQREMVWSYGVLHKSGSMDGSDIPVPSMFLIDCHGNIVWRYVARKVQSRLDPKILLNLVDPKES